MCMYVCIYKRMYVSLLLMYVRMRATMCGCAKEVRPVFVARNILWVCMYVCMYL